jgi:hypothetical protein
MRHTHRLARIERVVRPRNQDQKQSVEAHFQASLRAWDELAATMHPDHLEHLTAEIDRYGHRYESGHLGFGTGAGNLARQASSMVSDYVDGRLQGPLTLPTEVAAVYADDDDARPMYDCERCGYRVPFRMPIRGQAPYRYFDHCPLCGGQTGANNYLYSRQGQIERCQACGELDARTAVERAHLRRHGQPDCRCER